MSVSPDSFTEVTNLTNDGSTTGSAGTGETAGMFVSVPNNHELGSKVIGLDIYNNSNQDIGQIKDRAQPKWPLPSLHRIGRRLSGNGRALCRCQSVNRESQLQWRGQEVACVHERISGSVESGARVQVCWSLGCKQDLAAQP